MATSTSICVCGYIVGYGVFVYSYTGGITNDESESTRRKFIPHCESEYECKNDFYDFVKTTKHKGMFSEGVKRVNTARI